MSYVGSLYSVIKYVHSDTLQKSIMIQQDMLWSPTRIIDTSIMVDP